MNRIIALLLLAAVSPAYAQIQPGPNIAPGGARFLYAPRHGYIGPPMPMPGYALPYAPVAPLPPLLPPEPPPGELCVVDPADVGQAPFLNIRTGPNGWIIGMLPNGAQVVVRGLVGDWADIGIGFVYRPLLYCPPPPPPPITSAPQPRREFPIK